jgi:hypothetical protein
MRYAAFSVPSSTSFCGRHVQLRCFCIGLANCDFAECGAKRKKEKQNYPVSDKDRKIIQQARENLPNDRLLRITADACLESAATESVDLGKDSNFLGSQNSLRSSNHRVGGRAFGSRPNAWDMKCKSLVRKLLR